MINSVTKLYYVTEILIKVDMTTELVEREGTELKNFKLLCDTINYSSRIISLFQNHRNKIIHFSQVLEK